MLFLTNELANKAEITAWATGRCILGRKEGVYIRGSAALVVIYVGLTGTMSYVGICLKLWANQAVC